MKYNINTEEKVFVFIVWCCWIGFVGICVLLGEMDGYDKLMRGKGGGLITPRQGLWILGALILVPILVTYGICKKKSIK